MSKQVIDQLQLVKAASKKLVSLDRKRVRDILHQVAEAVDRSHSGILAANKKDLAKMSKKDPYYDRLLLDKKRLERISYDIQVVAEMRTPLNLTIEDRVAPSGLYMRRISVPMGVVGIVYEARPNVTFDVFALSFKAGNALVLKGGRAAAQTNAFIVNLIQSVLNEHDLQDVIYLMPSDRKSLDIMLSAHGLIDVVIPRGGDKLIQHVRENAKVPIIETGAGVVHTYFDESADAKIGRSIIVNAKTRRVSVCNALDTLIIHESRLDNLPGLLKGLDKKHKLQVFADKKALEALNGKYDKKLLSPARGSHYGTEFLAMKLAIKTVNSIDDALKHIEKNGSGHSEAIIAQDEDRIQRFYTEVDAAVVYSNASTAFTDGGEFGYGSEVGISTQKLHARGPMGLRALTSSKWICEGTGQIRD